MTEQKKLVTSFAWILILCLVLRLGYGLTLHKHPRNLPLDGYPEIAQNILDGKGFSPTPLSQWYFRTPGYPLFIAAVWSVVPSSARYEALELAQILLSVATCALLFVTADTVFARRAATIGAVLFAFSPSTILFSVTVLSETLHLFLIALAIWMALRLEKSSCLWTAIGLGITWGAAGLTRPEATLLLTPLLLPILVAKHRGISERLRLCATALATKMAVMAPWVARNYLVYGTFVLHVPLGGLGIFVGTYPREPGHFNDPITLTKEYREITAPYWDPDFLARTIGQDHHQLPNPFIVVVRNERDMLEIDRQLAAAAMVNIKKNTYFQLSNIPHHIQELWGHPSAWSWVMRPRPQWLDTAWYGSYLQLLVMCALGVVVAVMNGKLRVIPLSWLIVMALHTAVFLVINAEPRYQYLSTIFLFIFSGYGIAAILDFLERWNSEWHANNALQTGEKRHFSPNTTPFGGNQSLEAG